MPFWDEARQKRVQRRIAKIKEALKVTASLLQVGGMVIGGLGLGLFLAGIFLSFQVGWVIFAMVFGFGSYIVGRVLDEMLQVLMPTKQKGVKE